MLFLYFRWAIQLFSWFVGLKGDAHIDFRQVQMSKNIFRSRAKVNKLNVSCTHHLAAGWIWFVYSSLIEDKLIDCRFLALYSFEFCHCVSCDMTGLDGAGKTTILYRLQVGEVVTTIPTIGFNVEQVTYKNLKFQVWDLGGQTSIRPYWRCYYSNTDAIIYVVDSADRDRIGISKDELLYMLRVSAIRLRHKSSMISLK